MAYEKRLCILKQLKKGFSADGAPLTGAVYAERFGTDLTVTPRIAGLSPLNEGRYALAVWAGEREYCLEMHGNEALRVPGAPTLAGGFSALLCFVRGAAAEPIAYGFCGGAPEDYRKLLSVFAEGKRDKKIAPAPIPMPMPPNQLPGSPSPQVPLAPVIPLPGEEEPAENSAAARYNDEAIAATDYYELWHREETSGGGKDRSKDGAEDAVHPFRLNRGGLTYYREISAQLKETMARYPSDERLNAVFGQSKWVNADGALLGVIYEDGLPRYLCVAVEGTRGDPPPEEMKGRCVFVPADCFSDERGFFIVFQDADTGEYVKTEES